MQSDPGLQQRVNNALLTTLMSHNIHGQIQHTFQIMPGFYFFKIELHTGQNGNYLIHALGFDNQHECTLFLDAAAFRMLVLDPMTQDVKNAIKDYHAIGHQ